MKTTITREEFDSLYRNYRNMIRGVAYEYEKDTSRVSDLMHDIFLAAWESRDTFKGESQAQTWLYAIARNVCANYVRDNIDRAPALVPESCLDPEYDEEGGVESWLEQHYIDVEDPEAILLAEENWLRGMDDLTPTEQRVYSLMWEQDLSAEESAQVLNVSRSTIDVHVHNIRGKLS